MKINDDLLPIVVSAEEPVGTARKAIWKRHSKNLFDKDNYIRTLLYGDNGVLRQAMYLYGFIFDVRNYTKLTISKVSSKRLSIVGTSKYPIAQNNCAEIYGYSNGQPIENTATNVTIDITNFNYIIVSYYISNADTLTEQQILNTIQIELGTGATEYEPYADDKEYILNDNNVYEELQLSRVKSQVLFYSGSPGEGYESRELQDNPSNYDILEIFCKDSINAIYFSERIAPPRNGINFYIFYMSADYIFSTLFKLANNAIEPNTSDSGFRYLVNNTKTSTNRIRIIKVIGYKYK